MRQVQGGQFADKNLPRTVNFGSRRSIRFLVWAVVYLNRRFNAKPKRPHLKIYCPSMMGNTMGTILFQKVPLNVLWSSSKTSSHWPGKHPLINIKDVLSLASKTSPHWPRRYPLIILKDDLSLASKISSDHPQRRSLISLEDILWSSSKTISH